MLAGASLCTPNAIRCGKLIIINALITVQGVHTMLPVSWPVSVVLALILSIIHLGYRVASNFHSFPRLFFETVSTNPYGGCGGARAVYVQEMRRSKTGRAHHR